MAEPAPQQRGRDTPQPLSFSDFLEKMKDPGAADLVRVIKAFLKEFEDRGAAPPPRGAAADPQADSDRVQAFLEGTERLFRSHPAWRGSPPEVLDQAVEVRGRPWWRGRRIGRGKAGRDEPASFAPAASPHARPPTAPPRPCAQGLEKYVMSKVWRQVFGAWGEDAERDERYARLAQALSFVDLDALAGARGAAPDPALLALAQGELLRMDRYKAPRDKLLCLVNVKTMVEDVVVAAAAASGTPGGGLGGADAFFPVLLLVAIRARPPRLASNIEYLKRFRMRSRLTGQFDYMLANLVSGGGGAGPGRGGAEGRRGGWRGPRLPSRPGPGAAPGPHASLPRRLLAPVAGVCRSLPRHGQLRAPPHLAGRLPGAPRGGGAARGAPRALRAAAGGGKVGGGSRCSSGAGGSGSSSSRASSGWGISPSSDSLGSDRGQPLCSSAAGVSGGSLCRGQPLL